MGICYIFSLCIIMLWSHHYTPTFFRENTIMTKKPSKMHQRVLQNAGQSKSYTARQIDRIVENGMQIDRSKDTDMLSDINQTWEDLNTLRQALADATMSFTGQVYTLINNTGVLEALGPKQALFDKLVHTFFADAQAFSQRIAQLRAQHEHRSGAFTNLEEYGEFNKLALQYQNANDELAALLAPTVSELVLIVHEQLGNAQNEAAEKSNLIDPKVITDVEIKS